MKNEIQIDLIEEAMKNAFQSKQPQETSREWQNAVMALVQQEGKAENKAVERIENTLWHLSWIAAGIAAVLVLVFGLFFYNKPIENSIEKDLQNLYVDNSMTDILTDNFQ